MIKPRIGMTVRSGVKCPKNGVWKVVGTLETTTISFSRGNKMPKHDNRSVIWKLIIAF